MNPSRQELSTRIKKIMKEEGFLDCGIARAAPLRKEAASLRQWLEKAYHGEMTYMENHFGKRADPTRLVEGSRSVITVLHNYYPQKRQGKESRYRISTYAYGKDYHAVIREKLHSAAKKIAEITGNFRYRAFTDSAPIMDKVWARKSGLGWIGKNTCLISKKHGSFFFIGHLVCDLELENDREETKNYCGTCRKCLDACPTGALIKPGILDARKCISYLTIELKNEMPEDLAEKTAPWIFGCDVCQDVCPWNRFAKPHKENYYLPAEALLAMPASAWENLSRTDFNRLFHQSPLLRAGYEKIHENIRIAKRHS